MRSLLMGLALVAGLGFVSNNAHALVKDPVWACKLSFDAKGGGLQILVGHYELSGPGSIDCVDASGNIANVPVTVTFGGAPVSLRFAAGMFEMTGIATGIGVAGNPASLLGDYFVVDANAAVVGGAGATVGFHGATNAATLNVGIKAIKGVGFSIGLSRMTLSAR